MEKVSEIATVNSLPEMADLQHYTFDHGDELFFNEQSWSSAAGREAREPHYLAVIPASRGEDQLRPLIRSLAKTMVPMTVFVAHSERDAQMRTTPMLERTGMDYINAYIPPGVHLVRLGLEADSFPHAIESRDANNLAFKRNLGLLVLTALESECVLFIDDDIKINRPGNMASVLRTLPKSHYAMAGFSNSGMPDRSVVHHALGLRSEPFISGHALAVCTFNPQDRIKPDFLHFPNLYNEDWLYMREFVRVRTAIRVGRIRQLEYNPFKTGRSIAEEFGDTIAEGVYARGAQPDDVKFWRKFIGERRKVIAIASDAVLNDQQLDEEGRSRRLSALQVSHISSLAIEAADCKEYHELWMQDKRAWNQTRRRITDDLRCLPASQAVKRLFKHLDLPSPDYRIGSVPPHMRHRTTSEEYQKTLEFMRILRS